MKKWKRWLAVAVALVLAATALYFGVRSRYPRAYQEIAEGSGLDPMLVYAVMKSESDFREDAVSSAGAVGLMQLKPSTAEFICRLRGRKYDENRLTEGKYNAEIGCLYLEYLMERFEVTETAIAAYNAGEGTVTGWLKDANLSTDGVTLNAIPYAETRRYVKKVLKNKKIYEFFY